MQLENTTAAVVQLLRAQQHYRDLIMATVICKVTYHVQSDGTSALADAQQPLIADDELTPLGRRPSDRVAVKHGCDLAVFGHAYASPGARPTAIQHVELSIGTFRRSIVVYGDRVWKHGLGTGISSPAPFSALPIVYERAYGGRVGSRHALDDVWADNPEGTGFVVDPARTAACLLPNVEEADQPIRSWRDRPLTAGLAPLPMQSAMAGLRGFEVDLERQTTRMTPMAFNHAHPRMLLERYPAGARLSLTGMRRQAEPWSFRVPVHEYVCEVELGGRVHSLALTPDTLWLFPDDDILTVTSRRAFIYQFLPERARTIRVRAGTVPAALEPKSTIAQLRNAARPEVAIELAAGVPPAAEVAIRTHPFAAILESLPVCASN